MYEALQTQMSLSKQEAFNMANRCERIEIWEELNFHYHAKFTIAWIPTEFIGFCLRKFTKQW